MTRPITDARSALAARLSRPIKTDSDVKIVQRMIAMVLLDNAANIEKLARTVLGFNGTPGLVSLVALLRQQLDEMSASALRNHPAKPHPAKSDTFGRMVAWFVDKVLPTLVIVFITLAVTFIVDVFLHVDIFGVNPKGG
jgi:hypothetical protein